MNAPEVIEKPFGSRKDWLDTLTAYGMAVEMAKMMDVPVLGLVENMSYVKCPDCGREIHVFGESHIDEVAAKYGLKVLGKLPMEPKLAAA